MGIIAWLNSNPWAWALAVIILRALVKWNQAGRPNGLLGLLQSIISFVPAQGPQPGPTPDPQPGPDLLPLIQRILELFTRIRETGTAEDVAVVDQLETQIFTAAPTLLRHRR